MSLAPRAPTADHRVTVIGGTGSGKSQYSFAMLSTRNYTKMPWVLFDIKGEKIIKRLRKENPRTVHQLYLDDKVPTKPGLYVLNPVPGDDDEAVEVYLRKIWQHQGVGTFLDEGYGVEKSKALKILYTTGRSRYTPMVALFQRPVGMERQAIAQASFLALMRLNDDRDYEVCRAFMRPIHNFVWPEGTIYAGQKRSVYPEDIEHLPKYHVLWYDTDQQVGHVLRPAPSQDEILATFKRRLNTI